MPKLILLTETDCTGPLNNLELSAEQQVVQFANV